MWELGEALGMGVYELWYTLDQAILRTQRLSQGRSHSEFTHASLAF